ncbi:LacI family DNA-binding transcriptional regulator [Roseovarius gaetbuli]|nr:LacI family DNA-binding transcriptional regulator [Roseovarius gaetbuli]
MDENNIPKNTASNRRPTLSQVAAAAGVSEITASRAMRGGGLVAKATADRVQAAARELNYVPNRLAGTLAGGASRQVGVILPSLSNSVFADVLKGLEDRLEEAGYQPVLGISNYDPTREERLIENLLSWRPAGIVIAPADMTAASRALLLRAGLPVVEIMDVDATPTDMAVGISHLSAGRAMAHYLVGRGYERFAYLGHSIDSDLRALARLEGFRGALGEVGRELAQCLTLAGPSSVNLGREGLARLLAEAEQPPDLVYFSNDDMAVGGMFHCMAAGISVPGDLALAGFNGLEIGQALPVPLTTTASNRAAIGTEAARQLLQRFKGGMPEKISDVGFRLIPGQTA